MINRSAITGLNEGLIWGELVLAAVLLQAPIQAAEVIDLAKHSPAAAALV